MGISVTTANHGDGEPDDFAVLEMEMMMLAKTNLFVGQSTSNFFRFALELKSASCDCVPVFYSLDSPWCFDFAARAGKNVFSSSQGSESNWMC